VRDALDGTLVEMGSAGNKLAGLPQRDVHGPVAAQF
jgi:hypothetical protein